MMVGYSSKVSLGYSSHVTFFHEGTLVDFLANERTVVEVAICSKISLNATYTFLAHSS